MRHRLRTTLLATAIALAGVGPLLVPDAAMAQGYRGYSHGRFRDFHRILARYGDWVYSDRWGTVWIPDVPDNFRPYRTAGYWVNTRQYGWYWRSSYPWGDITFHYGRWVNDPYDGWLWIPGYVWSPGWVVWRGNNRYIGWMPMPPDRDFLRGNETAFRFSISGGGLSLSFGRGGDFYGYGNWYGRDYDRDRFASNWTFVGAGNLGDRDYGRNVVNQTNVVNVIQNTTNITNYTVVNNIVVNRSVDTRVVERASGRPVATVNAATVIKDPTLVTRVDEGRQAQLQAPTPIVRGTGQANSAPAPTAAVVSTLSDRPVERHGRPATGLFNKQTVQSAPLAPRAPTAGTPPAAGAAPAVQPPASAAAPATPAPNATPGAPQAGPVEKGGRNRERNRGEQVAPQGSVTPPTQNAPAANAPATTNPPAETGGRNRNRGGGEQGAPQGGTTAPAQSAPATTAPSANNPPVETGGRNRERNRGNRGEQAAPPGAMAPAPQRAPEATAPTPNNPPAETGGRNRERNRGGEQGVPSGGMAPPQNPPAATAPTSSNPPADNGGRARERNRGNPREQSAPQNAPAATPATGAPGNTTPPDNAHKKKNKNDNKDNPDNQGSNPPN